MDKRIKTVYVLSIVTLTLVLAAQGWWLYTQYQYTGNRMAEELKEICGMVISKEENLRLDGYHRLLRQRRQKVPFNMALRIRINGRDSTSSGTKLRFTFTLGNNRKIVLEDEGLNSTDGTVIFNRYEAGLYKPFQRELLDSLLTACGQLKVSRFTRLGGMAVRMEPRYTVSDSWHKTLHVTYCSNPMLRQGVAFDIPIGTTQIIRSMVWQMLACVLLVVVLAFCLYYQAKTIVIQKRIDRIRHEFMKNMIYEMKQPKDEVDSDDVVVVGQTLFRYGLNELQYGQQRVILTSRQAEIFRVLCEQPNQVVPREQILMAVWGDDSYANSMALNVQVSYLRRAIKQDATLSIDVLYKKGYMLHVFHSS